MALALLVLVGVSLLEGGEELGELGLVLGANLGQSKNGRGLNIAKELVRRVATC